MFFQFLFLFILGTFIGSFLSVVVPRLHEETPGIIFGRSHCTNCKKNLSPWQLIPVFSYLLLKGRCSNCKKTIPYFYPLLEIGTAFLFAASLFFVKNLGLNPFQLNESGIIFSQDLFLFIFWLFCLSILIFIFFFDVRYYLIDDRVMVPGILIALITIIFLPANQIFPDIKSALIGAAIPFFFFLIQILISKGKWIGSGDLRIGIFMGLILGWPKVLAALFLSYIIGSIVGLVLASKKGTIKDIAIPFGPFLVLGTIIAFFHGNQIIEWYMSLLI